MRYPNHRRDIPSPRRVIKITGHETREAYSAFGSYDPYEETCRYSWVEWHVDKETCGGERIHSFEGYSDDTPAVEINGATDIEEDTIVEAWLAPDGDHWLFNGSVGGSNGRAGNNGSCCFGAPTGIWVISHQVCCDNANGFSAEFFFEIFDPNDCVPYRFSTLGAAVDFANSFTPPLDTTVYGACPESEE